MSKGLQGRVVVVSPHLDDAVFSLGAAMSNAGASGAQVTILTVFGCDPASTAPANHWDTRGGFSTEGEAATTRRHEDLEACKLLGVRPLWLTFRGGGYSPHKDADAICAAIHHNLRDADVVLIPGFPLANEDHAWLAQLFRDRKLEAPRMGRYVEQPYASAPQHPKRPSGSDWDRTSVRLTDRMRKRRAMSAYASQLPLLSMGMHDLILLALRPELISWSAR